MCEYMRIKDGELPKCIDKSICTLCVLGNAKKYNELKKENHNEINK